MPVCSSREQLGLSVRGSTGPRPAVVCRGAVQAHAPRAARRRGELAQVTGRWGFLPEDRFFFRRLPRPAFPPLPCDARPWRGHACRGRLVPRRRVTRAAAAVAATRPRPPPGVTSHVPATAITRHPPLPPLPPSPPPGAMRHRNKGGSRRGERGEAEKGEDGAMAGGIDTTPPPPYMARCCVVAPASAAVVRSRRGGGQPRVGPWGSRGKMTPGGGGWRRCSRGTHRRRSGAPHPSAHPRPPPRWRGRHTTKPSPPRAAAGAVKVDHVGGSGSRHRRQ
ncbi:hypothetical protein I4F81_004793 [Pyropia yezoensis]|uniref:Uncharacterized protein n=1 Tax=Pyropia yezoensis TaxID=2788 RepID=A0ACC3BXA2_PYRYE|nr:hypothetical protein I4F81_004793 [Neopyropia yezoensis]